VEKDRDTVMLNHLIWPTHTHLAPSMVGCLGSDVDAD
jgi:hypothetical protein